MMLRAISSHLHPPALPITPSAGTGDTKHIVLVCRPTECHIGALAPGP